MEGVRIVFQGDPRHMPYADLKHNGASFPNGYNWHFDNLRNGDGDMSDLWRAFEPTRLRDGWRGTIDQDTVRLWE